MSRTPPKQDKDITTNNMDTTAMVAEFAATSPRTPATKRARHNNKSEGANVTQQDPTMTQQEFQATSQDSTKTQESSLNLLTQPQLTHTNETEYYPRSEIPSIPPSAQPSVPDHSEVIQDSKDQTVLESKLSDGTTSL